MAVDDRWHRDPDPGGEPCRCGRGRARLYPSAAHLKGRRWQVRWRDPATGKQLSRNFALRDGADPETYADAFDKVIASKIVMRTYTDPSAGEITLHAYAETWRKAQKLDVNTAAELERRLRLHVYEGKPGSGRTPKNGVAIGQYPMALLANQPSLMTAWIAAIPLANSTARQVTGHVGAIFRAAVDDRIVSRNPLQAGSVKKPPAGRGKVKRRPWTAAQVGAVRARLPGRWQIIPDLGAATAMRQGEMLGLGADDVQFLGRDPRVSVVRALKVIGGRLCYGPVKNRKPHTLPLAAPTGARLARHMQLHPPLEVTLPWHDPDDKARHGTLVTVRLIITTDEGAPVDARAFAYHWRKALRAAGITPPDGRERDDGCHVLRVTGVSNWLRGRVDIVRVAAWTGDTVTEIARTYAHLLQHDDDDDGRAAVEAFYAQPSAPDVPSATAE
jgi:integrase